MKKIIKLLLFFIILVALYKVYQNKETITEYLINLYVENKDIKIEDANKYRRDYDFNYVKNTTDFRPNNYQDLLNIFYTILNNGWNSFTFYCDKEYDNCIEDVEKLKNGHILSNINNFVHPYNSYKTIYLSSNSLGQVDVTVDKRYNEEDIKTIEDKVNSVIKNNITSNMSDKDKIKVIHDYIINNTSYDRIQEKTVFSSGLIVYKYASDKALGPVLYGKAICGGYTDYMQIFLEKLGIKSYKISSDNHIWNYVYVDGSYKHLDLTWDDPIVYDSSTGKTTETLLYKYFLISTDKLLSLDKKEHTYDTNIYKN